MSFDTYENLKKEIIDWSHRKDVDLRIDSFIDLAETKMRENETAILDLREFETTATSTLTTTTRNVALPSGYKSMRSIRLLEDGNLIHELDYRSPANLNAWEETGTPLLFTITSRIELDRIPDKAYTLEITYKADFVPLSSTANTNSILTNNPNIYLFGALWALREWSQESAEADRMYGRFIQEIKGANLGNSQGQYGPAPVMITDGPTP